MGSPSQYLWYTVCPATDVTISTSPSVYVIYSGAIASASCIAMSETYHQVGAVHTTTMAYNSADLSSVACINSLGSGNGSPVKWEPMNYANLYAPIPASESSARIAKCFTDPNRNEEWGDYMRNPFISLPQDISNADPLWSTCSAGILGAMDPPRKLTAAVSMVPVAAGKPNNAPAEPEHETLPAAIPSQTAIPGQPISAPIATSTGVHGPDGGEASTRPGTNDPGNSAAAPLDPSHASGPDPNPSGFQQPGPGPVSNPKPQNGPASSTPSSGPNTGTDPSTFQFGQGPQDTNPDDLTPAQLSVLHQALAPSPSSAAADSSDDPNAGQKGGNTSGTGTASVPDTQPHSNPESQPEAAALHNKQSPEIQLQPISSAIFDNQQPNRNEQQAPTSENAVLGNAPSESGSTETGFSGSDAPSVNTVPQGKNIPPGNAAPQETQYGNSDRFTGIASPAPANQGVPAGAAGQPALTRGPNGGLVIGSSTILPGQVATISNHRVSVDTSNVVVDSNTYAFAAPTTPTPSLITVAGLAMHKAPEGGVVMVGQTLNPGAQTTIGGHAISVGSGNVIVDGNTQILPTDSPATAPQVLVGGSVMQRASDGAAVLGGSTLAIGAQTTIAGHLISIGASNVVIDGTTNALPTLAPTLAPIIINGQTMQRASNGGVIIGTTTLAPGTQTTIGDQVVSVGPNEVVVGSSTYALASTVGAVVSSPASAAAQRNAITFPNGAVLSAGGGPITYSGNVVSVLSNDQGAVIDGSTVLFASSTLHSIFTVAGQTFTAASTGFALGGATLSLDGPAVTIAGTVVSLGPSGLQIGSSTIPLATASPTGLGGAILSAFDAPAATSVGSVSNGPNATNIVPFVGSGNGTNGARSKNEVWLLSLTVMLCVVSSALAILS